MTRTARRTTIAAGILATVAAGLTGGLATDAAAAPTWLGIETVSPLTDLPRDLRFAVSPNGEAVAMWKQVKNGEDHVFVSSRNPYGTWYAPVQLSEDGESSTNPAIAINAAGKAVATWQRFDGAHWRIQSAERGAHYSWGDPETLSDAGKDSIAPRVEVGPDGTAYVLWKAQNGTFVELGVDPVGAANATDLPVSTDDGYFADVAVSDTGKVVLAWMDNNAGIGDKIRARTYLPGQGFGATSTLFSGDLTAGVSVAANDRGEASVAYAVEVDGGAQIVNRRMSATNVWSAPDFVSAPGEHAAYPSLGLAADGRTVVSWRQGSSTVKYSVREPNADWPVPTTLASGVEVSDPMTHVNERGDALVSWGEATATIRFVLQRRGHAAQELPAATGPLDKWEHAVGLDDQANMHSLYRVKLDADTGRVLARVYDVAGPVASVSKPTAYRTNQLSFPVFWNATDRYSPVKSKQVLVRSAAWNGGFGATSLWKDDGTAATYDGVPGRTYCFAARGMDNVENLGALSAWRCTTTPTDDRKASGFTKKTGTGYFQGTFRTAKAKGSTLTLKGVKADRISLLVAKGPGHGKVAVYFAGKKLGAWSLGAATSKLQQQLQVADFAKVKTGTLKLVVVSSGKPVRIDGFHLAK